MEHIIYLHSWGFFGGEVNGKGRGGEAEEKFRRFIYFKDLTWKMWK